MAVSAEPRSAESDLPRARPVEVHRDSLRELLALAAAGGGLIATCFLRFELWPIAWLAFAPIVHAIRRCDSLRRAIAVGLIAGLATNLPAFSWLVHTIHVFGGFPIWLSVLFYVGLAFYSAVQFVLFAWALWRLGAGPACLVPAAVWVALEFQFPNLFPWRLANSQFHVPALIQVGDVTGPFGLTFLMVWASTLASMSLERSMRPRPSAWIAWALALTATTSYGAWRLRDVDIQMAAAPSVRLGLVQGNLSIEEKLDVRYLEGNLETYRDLSLGLAPAPDVVIWPESVLTDPLPRSLDSLSPAGREILGLRHPLFVGAITFDGAAGAERFYNSVMLIDGEGRVLGLSDKQILMPFGEFMPFGSIFPILKRISPQTGDFAAGRAVVPLDVPGVARFAPLNCYEDLKAPIARQATREGRAEILFSVANDGWFGATMAPYQHEALALWRAVENRRFLVRVTNTGVTDVIDALGRVRLRLPIFVPAATTTEVRRMTGTTIYTAFGDWFAWTITATVLAALAISARPRGRSERPNRPRPRD